MRRTMKTTTLGARDVGGRESIAALARQLETIP